MHKEIQQEILGRKTKDRKTTMVAMTKMMIQEATAREDGLESGQIRRRNKKSLVLKALVTSHTTCITKMLEIQEEIVAAAVESNLWRQSQTDGTTFCLPSLSIILGMCVNDHPPKVLGWGREKENMVKVLLSLEYP